MATFVKIRNINRTPLRIGSTRIPTDGTVAQIDLDLGVNRRDLYRHIGRWAIVEDSGEKVAKVALAAVDTAGGVLAWANPEGASILVTRVILDVTTQSSGACTVDVGVAANGTTSNDTLIDGLSVATAGVLDNALAATLGTNGKTSRKVTSGQYVTASVATGASSGLVGNAYIFYRGV